MRGTLGKGEGGKLGIRFGLGRIAMRKSDVIKKRTVDGKIMKTVRVSVHEDASRGEDDERARSRTESIMVKLDV
jgi:hypothetical protein